MRVNVLGVDPGFASCGHAELEIDGASVNVVRLGVIRTSKSRRRERVLAADDNTRRARELSSLIGMMIGDSAIVCSESLSHPRVRRKDGSWTIAVKSACQNSIVWGVVVAHAQHGSKPLLQVTPAELRKRLGLPGNAKKEIIVETMRERFGRARLDELLLHVPRGQHQHAYDALAAAVACLDSDEVRLAIAVGSAVSSITSPSQP